MNSLDILNSKSTEQRIRVLLAAQNMTQSKLATYLGLSRSAFSQRMAGKTKFTADEIVTIADVLAVTPNDLLSGTSVSTAE